MAGHAGAQGVGAATGTVAGWASISKRESPQQGSAVDPFLGQTKGWGAERDTVGSAP